jgi:hypothetical protein
MHDHMVRVALSVTPTQHLLRCTMPDDVTAIMPMRDATPTNIAVLSRGAG